MEESGVIKQTVLCETHKKMGAKMAPFGGWLMPISYSSVLNEHDAVRNRCGVFDVSHMGEIRIQGKEALLFLNSITSNDPARLEIGHGQYSAILNEAGGFIDDLIVYRLGVDEYFVCMNAGNIDKDVAWFLAQSRKFDVKVQDESKLWAQLAVQGPQSRETLAPLIAEQSRQSFLQLPYTNILKLEILGISCLVARTGYTGELGYEIYLPVEKAHILWSSLVEGASPKAAPIGLGARDTLRLEACYLLYGNDMNESTSPLEAGIAWAVKLDQRRFIGSDSLRTQKEKGIPRTMIAFKLDEAGVPRHGMPVIVGDEVVGEVTSGGVLPTVGGSGGMALIKRGVLKEGDNFFVDVRGKRKLAHVMKRPLYSAKVKS